MGRRFGFMVKRYGFMEARQKTLETPWTNYSPFRDKRDGRRLKLPDEALVGGGIMHS